MLAFVRIASFAVAGLAVSATSFAQGRLLGVDGSNLVEINPTTGVVSLLGAITTTAGTIGITGALAYDAATDTLYLSSTTNDNIWKLDYNTRVASLIGAYNVGASVVMHGLEWDSGNGTLYGYSTNPSPTAADHRFFRIDTTTGQATGISNPAFGGFGSLGYVPATNTMYLADTSSGTGRRLYTIDVTTGAVTLVGPFGVDNQVGAGLAYDTTFGMIACNNSGTDSLYTIDLNTGAATLISTLTTGNMLAIAFVGAATPPGCYANCDNSTVVPVLNVNDFTCFLNTYAAGNSQANCDASTTAPVLNVNDFTCFLNRYAAGCP